MTLDEIQQAIARLPPDELARLRAWLAQRDPASAPAPGPAPDATPSAEPVGTARKLGRLTGRAFADFRKRMRET